LKPPQIPIDGIFKLLSGHAAHRVLDCTNYLAKVLEKNLGPLAAIE